ncbi:MAG: hypothetical protein R3C53_01605 [Pirellulaceae bacterium]
MNNTETNLAPFGPILQRLRLGMRGHRAGNTKLLVVLGLLVMIGVGIWIAANYINPARPGDDPGDQALSSQVTLPLFQKAVEAVAATEEADFRRAIKLWDELSAAQPDRATFRMNQAIAALKWISDINAEISSGRATPEEITQLNTELDEAYIQVQATIDQLAKLEIDSDRGALIQAALLDTKAMQSVADASRLRMQAIDILTAQLRRSPGEPLMSAKYEDLASQLAIDHPELNKLRAEVLYQAAKRSPRNLYLCKSAADALLREEDPRLIEVLDSSLELAQPMMGEPMVARNLKQVKLDDLIPSVKKAIGDGDWSKARLVSRWLNTMLAASGFTPDSKLVKPDVLALLDASILPEMAEQLDKASVEHLSDPLPKYVTTKLGDSVTAAAWYDFDFDLDFDVVVASNQGLQFYDMVDGQLAKTSSMTLDVGFSATGMLPLDMFEVQLPSRPKPPGSVAELMQATDPGQTLTEEQKQMAKRHDSLQELLIWNADGMRIVTTDENENLLLVEAATGLEDIQQVRRVVAVDFESDGDLDLAAHQRWLYPAYAKQWQPNVQRHLRIQHTANQLPRLDCLRFRSGHGSRFPRHRYHSIASHLVGEHLT